MGIPLTPVQAGISMAVRVVPRGGRTGIAGTLQYDITTGRLNEGVACPFDPDDSEEEF